MKNNYNGWNYFYFLLLAMFVYLIAAVSGAFTPADDHNGDNQGGYEVETTVINSPDNQPGEKLVFPIKGQHWTSSQFGLRRSPFNGRQSIHYGTDLIAYPNSLIVAMKSGVVVVHYPPPDERFKGHDIFGGYIEILHDDGLSSYGHMSNTFVYEGMSVRAGDIIGVIGNTGKVAGKTGVHLHIEYRMNIERMFQ